MFGLYSKSSGPGRLAAFDPTLVKVRRKFILVSWKRFLLLLLLFLSLYCYIFGSLLEQGNHIHNLTIGFVDYDGGAVGQAFRAAYTGLQGPNFPVVAEYDPSEFPRPADLTAAVCRIDFWATIYIAPGASDKLNATLAGSTSSDATLDKTDIVAYTWNEARYPVVVDSAIMQNIEALSASAAKIYGSSNSTQRILNVTAPGALSVLVDPWHLREFNLQPTSQGPRSIYNTIVIVLVLVQGFFYISLLNGAAAQLKFWALARPRVIIAFRLANSLTFAFFQGLCITGAIWAFRGDWDVGGGQFVLTWMTFWVFIHISFSVLDMMTAWVPLPYVPMTMISWVLMNVTAVLLPTELKPGFYKGGTYIAPADAAFNILLDIWSGGCNPQLPYALPTLFAWEIVAAIGSGIAVYHRAHNAALAKEREEQQQQEKAAALAEVGRQQYEQELPTWPGPRG